MADGSWRSTVTAELAESDGGSPEERSVPAMRREAARLRGRGEGMTMLTEEVMGGSAMERKC